MKLLRLGRPGQERPAALVGDRLVDLSRVLTDYDAAFFAGDGIERLAALAAAGFPGLPDAPSGQRVGAPVARPGTVICIGMNYAAHAAESGAQPPTEPVLFLKPGNTVAGPSDDVPIPRRSTKTDWEVELGVVIGAPALYLDSPEQARACIAGFVLANDVSERAFQLEVSGGQWSKGKSAPGFTPLGPWLVTPDEFDHRAARLRSSVNGEPRQDSSTADMIFGVEHLIRDLSQYLRLEPGDLVLTGTPAGVALSGRFPYLTAGDVVELSIDGLGTQRQTFVPAS
ncbi:MAG TPA: fumarylacetoacetate hydrolase family protein [Pseudonocardiaceae bacterium]|nr:fumarylacetoacetate hydrolase family protein [Pseudonocardiaceae bacterium]